MFDMRSDLIGGGGGNLNVLEYPNQLPPGWATKFDAPIPLPEGKSLVTLRVHQPS